MGAGSLLYLKFSLPGNANNREHGFPSEEGRRQPPAHGKKKGDIHCKTITDREAMPLSAHRLRQTLTAREQTHSSPSPSFSERMEAQRLSRECFCLLDLRKLSPDLCRRYSYRGRTMWLDAAARELFMSSLQENSGVFTVGSYERILRPYHGRGSEKPQGEYRHWATPQATTSLLKSLSYHHRQRRHSSLFELGYFEKRTEERVKHVMPVLVLTDSGQVIPAETRNISFRGLLVKTKLAVQLKSGDRIRIKIPAASAEGKSLAEARYRIVHIKSLISDSKLALVSEASQANETLEHLRRIVSPRLGRSASDASIDTEDALLTSHALLAERYYLRSSTMIPLFLFRVSNRETPLKIVFSNDNNLSALKAFEVSPGNYDLSSLSRHNFIKLLVKLARRESQADALLAVLPSEPGVAPYTLTNLECEQSLDWYRFLTQHIGRPGFKVFKVLSRYIHIPSSHRVMNDLDALAIESTSLAEQLIEETERLLIAASLIDVTPQIENWKLDRHLPGERTCQAPLPDRTESDPPPAPEVWPVRFIENRRSENRFVGEVRVTVRLGKREYGGRTRDISAHGLSVLSDDPAIPATAGERLLVSFPGLKRDASSIGDLWGSYRDIPYRVVAVEHGASTLLRMKQLSGVQSNRFARTFAQLIEERRGKLPMELSHLRRSAASRLYASYFVESSGTLPLFVFGGEGSHRYSLSVGLSRSPSYLASFFEVAEGEFDFSPLADLPRLNRLIPELEQKGHIELSLFLYKEAVPGSDRFRLGVIEDNRPNQQKLQTCFVNQLLGVDFRYLKLLLATPAHPGSAEIEQAIERLKPASKTRAGRLSSEFSQLVAVGDIVDITGQLGALQPFSLYG